MTDTTYSIADLAREFRITPRAIRYYEDHRLLAPERRGLQRVYSKRDRTRLKLTLRGKRLGLSLAEIRELIDMYDAAADQNPQLQKFLAVLAQRKAALEQQREDIEAVLAEINRFEHQCQQLLIRKPSPPRRRKVA
jgi:DNA-binding transcriptional MerR regulator